MKDIVRDGLYAFLNQAGCSSGNCFVRRNIDRHRISGQVVVDQSTSLNFFITPFLSLLISLGTLVSSQPCILFYRDHGFKIPSEPRRTNIFLSSIKMAEYTSRLSVSLGLSRLSEWLPKSPNICREYNVAAPPLNT